jgi:hypothetical protein
MQRASFKLISDEHQSWGGIATESFPERGTGQTAFNAFVALNLKGAVDKSGDGARCRGGYCNKAPQLTQLIIAFILSAF